MDNFIKTQGNHIFKILVEQYDKQVSSSYQSVLSEQELQKSNRFIHQHDCKTYLVTRYAIRNILSHFISVPPREVRFYEFNNKKPTVQGIEFNITHSNNLVFIAVSLNTIGIDAEFINRKFDFESLLATCFSSKERSFITGEKEKLLSFYALWTRKEAILKASGDGINDHMNHMDCMKSRLTYDYLGYNLTSYLIDSDYVMSLATKMNKPAPMFFWNY